MSSHTWTHRLFARKRTCHGSGYRPQLEALEDRLALATLTVLTTGDGNNYEVIPTGPSAYSISTLRGALDYAYGSPGADTILFATALAGQTITPTMDDIGYPTDMGHTAFVITKTITIQGDATHGITLDGAGARRLFGVAPSGNLTLQNLTLTGGVAVGGNGGVNASVGGGGGGGAGLGGAIYIYKGSVTLTNCTLTGNTAQGGSGGSIGGGSYGASGGGSAAFDGGSPTSGRLGASAGGGGAGMYGAGGDGELAFGGSGGPNQDNQQAEENQSGRAGGGGGGGTYTVKIDSFGNEYTVPHSGGAGIATNLYGFGGGGGGGAVGSSSSSDAPGGAGGFGAGGGGGGSSDGPHSGGQGGFGGGGGGAAVSAANSGAGSVFGEGTGGATISGGPFFELQGGGGGGGAGLGGAIFLNSGYLALIHNTITGNTANGGAGGTGSQWSTAGTNGSGYGGAIFVLNSSFLEFDNNTISGNTSSSGGHQVYYASVGDGPTATPPAGQVNPIAPPVLRTVSIQGGPRQLLRKAARTQPHQRLRTGRLRGLRRPLHAVVLTFSGPVTVAPGAIRLSRANGGRPIPVSVLSTTTDGDTTVRLIVGNRPGKRRGPAKLIVDGNQLFDAAGNPLPALTREMILLGRLWRVCLS